MLIIGRLRISHVACAVLFEPYWTRALYQELDLRELELGLLPHCVLPHMTPFVDNRFALAASYVSVVGPACMAVSGGPPSEAYAAICALPMTVLAVDLVAWYPLFRRKVLTLGCCSASLLGRRFIMPSRGGRPLLLRLGMLMTSTRLGMVGSNSRMVRTGDTSLREEGFCLGYMYVSWYFVSIISYCLRRRRNKLIILWN